MVDWSLAINVTITGLVLVFTMLLLLVFILIIFGWISTAIKIASEKKAAKAREALFAALSDDSHLEENTNISQTENSTISNEIVAVISAAISTLYINSGKTPVIKTIKPSSGRRSAWGNAGVADNTRSF